MSHLTYNKLWRNAHGILDNLTKTDLAIQTSAPGDIEKARGRILASELYVKYIICANQLIECAEQMVQPQKLLLVQQLLNACFARIIEIKHDLRKLDNSDYNFIDDDILIRNRLAPMDLEIKIPSFFKNFRIGFMENWCQFIDDILIRSGFLIDKQIMKKPLTQLEAILIIQTHERARQGRIRSEYMKEIKLRGKSKVDPLKDPNGCISILAAVKIQKIWRGYTERRLIRKKKIEEMLLIGMLPPLKVESKQRDKQKEIWKQRKLMQIEFKNDYEIECEKQRLEFKKKNETIMIEEMKEDIRNWLMEFKNHCGRLPEYPSDERGGSRLMLSKSGFSSHGTSSEHSKSSNVSSTKEKKSSDKIKDKASSASKSIQNEETDELDLKKYFRPVQSNVLEEIIADNIEFEKKWKFRDDQNNVHEDPYIDLIIAEKSIEVEKEIRKIVDGMMREELKQLQAALDRDRLGKGKRSKKPQKTRRGGKKSKKKREKDLTPDRTLESLFEELVCNGIIKNYPKMNLNDFIGEKSFAPKRYGTLGDIRQIVAELCILPLASQYVHENSPLLRSMLISGAEGMGKKTIVYTICTETDAILFDISPSNIVGKYPGKSGLAMLIHLVYKVGKLLQPSVILIGDAEKVYMKKVPKTDKTDPKRLKKDLPKLVKSFGQEDRVLIIGTSSKPWDCDQKLLIQTYDHLLNMPKPIHGDLMLAWKQALSYYPVLKHFDVGTIARLSNGYAIGKILDSVKEVMTTRRVVQLRTKPLQYLELINCLSKRDPIWKEHEEALLDWYKNITKL